MGPTTLYAYRITQGGTTNQGAAVVPDLLFFKDAVLEDPNDPTPSSPRSIFSLPSTGTGSRCSMEGVEGHIELEAAAQGGYALLLTRTGKVSDRVRLLFDSSSIDCYTGQGHGGSAAYSDSCGHRGMRHSANAPSLVGPRAALDLEAYDDMVAELSGAGMEGHGKTLPHGMCLGSTYVLARRCTDGGQAAPCSHGGLPSRCSSAHQVQRSLLDDLMMPMMGRSISEALSESQPMDSSI